MLSRRRPRSLSLSLSLSRSLSLSLVDDDEDPAANGPFILVGEEDGLRRALLVAVAVAVVLVELVQLKSWATL